MVTGDDGKPTAMAANAAARTAKSNLAANASVSQAAMPSTVAAKSAVAPTPKPVVVADATAPVQSTTNSSTAKPATGAPLPLNNSSPSSNTIPTLSEAQLNALMASINQKGIDPEMSVRAMDAYRRMNDSAATSPTVQQLH
jgi:hypothetical protein